MDPPLDNPNDAEVQKAPVRARLGGAAEGWEGPNEQVVAWGNGQMCVSRCPSFMLGAVGRIGSAPLPTLAQEVASPLPASMAPRTGNAVANLASAQEALLSGRVVVVATGRTDEPATKQDVVCFTGPLISTDLCTRFGFQPAASYLQADGDILHFMADLVSAEQGELRFEGRIMRDRLMAMADFNAEHAAWLD